MFGVFTCLSPRKPTQSRRSSIAIKRTFGLDGSVSEAFAGDNVTVRKTKARIRCIVTFPECFEAYLKLMEFVLVPLPAFH
jgi:hypothetical protein